MRSERSLQKFANYSFEGINLLRTLPDPMRKKCKVGLLNSAYLTARLGTSTLALMGVLTALTQVVVHGRQPPWAMHAWQVAIVVLAVSSVALYAVRAWTGSKLDCCPEAKNCHSGRWGLNIMAYLKEAGDRAMRYGQ
jgi:hypothetical protein